MQKLLVATLVAVSFAMPAFAADSSAQNKAAAAPQSAAAQQNAAQPAKASAAAQQQQNRADNAYSADKCKAEIAKCDSDMSKKEECRATLQNDHAECRSYM